MFLDGNMFGQSVTHLSARQMLSALYAIARLSVRSSVTRVDQSKTVEDRIMQLSQYIQ